jgi:parallel beta-helix repeat protein
VFQPGSRGAVVGNTLIKNGGGISVQDGAQADLKGNTIASAP